MPFPALSGSSVFSIKSEVTNISPFLDRYVEVLCSHKMQYKYKALLLLLRIENINM